MERRISRKRIRMARQRWRFPFISVGIWLLFTGWGGALEGSTARYRLMIRENPATTICIGWDQVSGDRPVVHYGPVDHGQDFEAYPMQKRPDRMVVYKGMNNHFARIRGLFPNTAYYFVIHDSEGVSERFWFKTLPNDSREPISIVAGGDSRRSGYDTSSYEPRVLSNIMVARLLPHFVIFAGDFTNRNSDSQWRTWFDDWQYATAPDGRMFALVPARGNHEMDNEDIVHLFDAPHPSVYYALDFCGDLFRLYTLNSNIPISGDQTDWLQRDLEQNQGRHYWTIVQYHHPIVPHQSSKTYKILQYRYWAPLFYQYHVQMVIECDSHVAKNSWPIIPSNRWYADGGFVRNEARGTVYTGEGSWGITRPADVNYRWTRESGSFTQIKWLKVTPERIEVRTVKTSNARLVNAVTEEARFNLPLNLDLWNTRNGSVMVIDRPHTLSRP